MPILDHYVSEPFATTDLVSLKSRLGADIAVGGLTEGEPATVEIAIRPQGSTTRRLRIRRFGDGRIAFGAAREAEGQGLESLDFDHARGRFARLGGWVSNLLFGAVVALGIATLTGLVTLHVVASSSMVPALHVGDLIVAVSDELSPPNVGDVVIFAGTKLDGSAIGPFAHRIVRGGASEGWITRGDANPSDDPFVSGPVEIRGRMLFTVPGVGSVLEPRVLLVLLGGLLIVLLLR